MLGFSPLSTQPISSIGGTSGGAVSYSLNCEAGTYSITGQDAALVYTSHAAIAYSLTCDEGNYTISGQDIELTYHSGQQVAVYGGGGGGVKSHKVKRSTIEETEKAVAEAFDKVLGIEVSPIIVEEVRKEVEREFKQIPLEDYDIAMAQVQSLIENVQKRIKAMEDELDDEEALLMLI